jgi:AraC-like DNA-binding protein
VNARQGVAAVSFEGHDGLYYADTCEPLEQAAQAGEVHLDAVARGHYPGAPLAPGCLPGVRTIGHWDALNPQSWGLEWHRNEGIEITYLAAGSVGFAVDGDEWMLEADQVTVTRPWQRHRVGLPNIGRSHLYWLILDVGVRRPNQTWDWPDWLAVSPEDLELLTILLQHNEYAVWDGNDSLADAFRRVGRLLRAKEDRRFESEMRILVSVVLVELLKTLEAHKPKLDRSLVAPRRSVSIFLDDLSFSLDHKWSVGEMAKACGMGRTQFTQHCQALFNMSPAEVLSAKRIERAASMLEETSVPVTDIAISCGFVTPQYLATRFRQARGESPVEYRRRRQSGGYGGAIGIAGAAI